MADDFFNVPDGMSDELNQGMNLGGRIELPFTAPFVYWKNGAANFRSLAQTLPAV